MGTRDAPHRRHPHRPAARAVGRRLLLGPKTPDGNDTYVLCEINASCVTPFPPEAPAKIASVALQRIARHTTAGSANERTLRRDRLTTRHRRSSGHARLPLRSAADAGTKRLRSRARTSVTLELGAQLIGA